MWELRNDTEFETDWTISTDKHGARHWVVVIKGTFDIAANGATSIAPEQEPIHPGPVYSGEDGASSLRYEADLQLGKPTTDIYVNGSAHAPEGKLATEVVVGINTPCGQKTLVVRGDRVWKRSISGELEPSSPKPFVTMPISYERAFGGFDKVDADPAAHRLDPRNPVGTGFVTSNGHRAAQLVPNVLFPGKPLNVGPAGFGAICSHWDPRVRYQGTYDAKWIEHRRPLLPEDWDPKVLQCAPTDQQSAQPLRGGEQFGLVNMSPAGTVRFALPKHYFGLQTGVGRKRYEHRARIQTVIVEPAHPRVIVVWQSTLSKHHEIDNIDFTRIDEKEFV